jgi:hypothetical protein
MKPKSIIAHADGCRPLAKCCADLVADLEDAGATERQIDAMTVAFYLGAGQCLGLIDRAARARDIPAFLRLMNQMYRDIDAAINHDNGYLRSSSPAGNA